VEEHAEDARSFHTLGPCPLDIHEAIVQRVLAGEEEEPPLSSKTPDSMICVDSGIHGIRAHKVRHRGSIPKVG